MFPVAWAVLILLQIWDAVPKPHAHKETPLSEFFNVKSMTSILLQNMHYAGVIEYHVHFPFQVQVVGLSSYEEKEELFKEQVGVYKT